MDEKGKILRGSRADGSGYVPMSDADALDVMRIMKWYLITEFLLP